MNATELVAMFERAADAPDAVAKLRSFVLDLAVRGRLVPQCSPAATQRGGENEVAESLASTCDLPTSWTCPTLEEVARYGLPEKVSSDKDVDGHTWILDLEDIEKGTGRLLNRVRASSRPFQSAKTRFAKGDVLFGKLRPYLCKVHVADEDGACTTEIVAIRPKDHLASEYLALVLRSPFTMNRVGRLMYGMKMPRLGTSDACALRVPLPPLKEQQRIVAKVDELMALCDQLEAARGEREAARDRLAAASLARLNAPDPDTFQADARFALNVLPVLSARPDQVKQLRQTILNLAVHGRLIPQDLDQDSTGQSPLMFPSQSANGRARSLGAEGTRDIPAGPQLPDNWHLATLSALSRKIQYGYTASADASLTDVRMLRITDIQDDSVDWEGVPGCVIAADEVAKYKLEPDDILIARTGGTIGKSFLIDSVKVVAVFASYLIRVQPSRGVFARYLKVFLGSPLYWEQLGAGTRGTGQPNVNGQTLGRLTVPLPPLAEQFRIVAKVDELMALCDKLEASLKVGESNRSRLLEALLHEALEPVANVAA